MNDSLDILDRLNDYINSLNLFAHSRIGLLDIGNSVSIMSMPGGEERVYLDGIRDKEYQVQINAKSDNQNNCFNSLTSIYQNLERLDDLPSSNGSYDFQGIKVTSLPNMIGQDDQGFFIWAINISIEITIYEE